MAQYLAALERDHGIAGRLLGLGVVDGCVPPLWETRPEDFPLAGVVLDATRGRGVIVHSHYVEERVREWGYGGPVWRIPHPAWPEPEVDPVDLGDGPVIGCLGHLNASKRIPQLLEAFARVHAAAPEARLLLVGAAAPQLDLPGRIARLGLPPEAIVREEYVDERRFWSLMAAADVVVSLRAPTMGETSGSAIRALSLGRPLVVSDVGLVRRAPGRGRAEGAGRRARDRDVLAATLELLLDARRPARGDERGGTGARRARARPRPRRRPVRRRAGGGRRRRRRPRVGARRGGGGRGGGRDRGRLRGGSRDRGPPPRGPCRRPRRHRSASARFRSRCPRGPG